MSGEGRRRGSGRGCCRQLERPTKHPDLPEFTEVAIAITVNEYGATVGPTVAIGVPEQESTYWMSEGPRYGVGPDDIHISSDDLETAYIDQDVTVRVLKHISFAIAVEV